MEFRGLRKGANAPISGNRCTVVVASGAVDVFIFQVGTDGRVRSDADVVRYNQPASPEGAVLLTGPGAVTVLLDVVPASVAAVTIAVAASDVDATSPLAPPLDVTATTDTDGWRWAAGGLLTEHAALLAEVYRRAGAWKLRNVSAGWERGLPALFQHFGVDVDQADGEALPAMAAGTVPVHGSSPVPAAVAPAPSPPAAADGRPAPTGAVAGQSTTKKRLAWLAAVVAAILVLAAVFGRGTDSKQTSAQPAPAGAPGLTSALLSNQSPPQASPTASAAVSSTANSAALQALAAPPAFAAVRTGQAAQVAVTALQALRVAGRAPKTGYSRAQFGDAWTDDVTVAGGHNGCDTRIICTFRFGSP